MLKTETLIFYNFIQNTISNKVNFHLKFSLHANPHNTYIRSFLKMFSIYQVNLFDEENTLKVTDCFKVNTLANSYYPFSIFKILPMLRFSGKLN